MLKISKDTANRPKYHKIRIWRISIQFFKILQKIRMLNNRIHLYHSVNKHYTNAHFIKKINRICMKNIRVFINY